MKRSPGRRRKDAITVATIWGGTDYWIADIMWIMLIKVVHHVLSQLQWIEKGSN